MTGRSYFLACFAILALLAAPPASAELVVVANASSGVERLSRDEVINIFLGRYRQLPSGIAALPIDQPSGSPVKAQFYRKLVNKDLAEINTYWARLTFSGKTSPPRQAASTAEVLDWLASTRGAIGYVEREKLDERAKDERIRIVLELTP
ncbi:MAG: hypothetical protein Q8O37_08515 [Sulfuricellaceae bacterium]|nr:hypothetical protein [Sulfuricellaceae bacterium]